MDAGRLYIGAIMLDDWPRGSCNWPDSSTPRRFYRIQAGADAAAELPPKIDGLLIRDVGAFAGATYAMTRGRVYRADFDRGVFTALGGFLPVPLARQDTAFGSGFYFRNFVRDLTDGFLEYTSASDVSFYTTTFVLRVDAGEQVLREVAAAVGDTGSLDSYVTENYAALNNTSAIVYSAQQGLGIVESGTEFRPLQVDVSSGTRILNGGIQFNGSLFVRIGCNLYRTDGTTAGTIAVSSFTCAPETTVGPKPFAAVVGQSLVFLTHDAIDGGRTLWALDNQAPITVPDGVTSASGATVTIDVLANDEDRDGALVPATTSIALSPANGTAIVDISTGRVTYTPNAGFSGIDRFSYVVSDNNGLSSAATSVAVTIPVTPRRGGGGYLSPTALFALLLCLLRQNARQRLDRRALGRRRHDCFVH